MVLVRGNRNRNADGTLKKTTSFLLPQDLEAKFDKLHVTPRETDFMGISKKARKRRSRKISSMDKAKPAAKPSGSGVTDVFPLPIPLDLYEFVKEAIEAMKHPDWSNDMRSVIDLGSAEYKIGVLSRCFRTSLPPGWKYERENASSLIAGRDKLMPNANGNRFEDDTREQTESKSGHEEKRVGFGHQDKRVGFG